MTDFLREDATGKGQVGMNSKIYRSVDAFGRRFSSETNANEGVAFAIVNAD